MYMTLSKQMGRDLMAAYKRLLHESVVNIELLDNKDKADLVRNSRAPRLYISAEMCWQLIDAYNRHGGVTLKTEEPAKRQLYCVEEYRKLMNCTWLKNKTHINICRIIVNKEAPSFFCSRRTCCEKIFWYKTIELRNKLKQEGKWIINKKQLK